MCFSTKRSMEKGELLLHTRWDILNQIARGKRTTVEISRGAKTSLPNVSQQLRLLEAHNLVEQTKERGQGPGKPRQIYTLKKPICHMTLLADGLGEQLFFTMNEMQQALLRVFLLPPDEQPFVVHIISTNNELLDACSIAYVRSTDAIELLLLTEDVEGVRKKYSNIISTVRNKSRKIVSWTHSVGELREGLARGEEYFHHLMRHKVLHDPEGRFRQVTA